MYYLNRKSDNHEINSLFWEMKPWLCSMS